MVTMQTSKFPMPREQRNSAFVLSPICAGSLTLVDGAFPAISAEKSLAIRYKAKVSASEAVTNINAATIVFTIAAVNEKEAA